MIWLGLALIGVTIFAAGTAIGWDKIIRRAEGVLTAVSVDRSHGEEKFPELPKNLSTHQRKILELARQEFLAQSPGAKFSEGATEPWCANFVSWVMHRAGSPLKNPHSESWRIPGTFTLREYYESEGRFRTADSGYKPQPGDAAIYRSSPIFGDHANIVISHDSGVLTTVGGNEINRIRVYINRAKNYEGLVGYGVSAEN